MPPSDPVALQAPSSGPLGTTSKATTWALQDGANEKHGAGIIFFAYGGPSAVSRFLEETMHAARSFRRLNPLVPLAVVSNNATVDGSVFDHHILPREDLLFPGSACPYGHKGCDTSVPARQWATRLYYMAHSPFELTWALDSNVVNCIPNGVTRFLQEALRSRLWGFDIAHANQAKGAIYPHNWNIMFLWTVRTANLMRDWFLLQLRRGISTDDQATLYAAELRQRASGGLNVGQMPTSFAAAFYSPYPSRGFYPRISRSLHGPAHVLHAKPAYHDSWCQAFNAHTGVTRQLSIISKGGEVHSFTSPHQCRVALSLPKDDKIPFVDADAAAASHIFKPRMASPSTLKLDKWR